MHPKKQQLATLLLIVISTIRQILLAHTVRVMNGRIVRIGLVVALMLPQLFPMSSARASLSNTGEPSQTDPLSTLSDIGFYPLIFNGKTDIAIAACADVANFQFRSEQTGQFLSQIFVRSTRCPVALSGSWRAVVGAVPSECFTIYIFATEATLSEADFMARAARYSVCVTGLGSISTPQRQSVTAPVASIDAPAAGATVQGTITISGWAINAASWSGPGVDQVQIYDGATLLGSASYGQTRTDVASAYGDSRYTNSGYVYQLDTKRLTNGGRTIQMRYYSAGSQLGSINLAVTVDNPTVGKPVQPTPIDRGEGDWRVPYYSQGDQAWRDNKIGACSNTIGNVGCALTSLAMIFKFYGVNQNPGTLNNCLGSDACLMKWQSSKIGSCSGGKVTWSGWPAFSYARLDQELKTKPVILELHNSASGRSHFIVVIGGGNGKPYHVNDPGVRGGANNNLSDTLKFWYTYNNFKLIPSSMRLYSGTPAINATNIESTVAPHLDAPQPTAGEIVTGTVAIYTNTEAGVVLELAAQSIAGSNVTDMRIWTDQHPSDIWQPFSPYVQVPLDGIFYAQFRDASGNTSATIEAGVPVALSANIQQDVQQVYLPMILQ